MLHINDFHYTLHTDALIQDYQHQQRIWWYLWGQMWCIHNHGKSEHKLVLYLLGHLYMIFNVPNGSLQLIKNNNCQQIANMQLSTYCSGQITKQRNHCSAYHNAGQVIWHNRPPSSVFLNISVHCDMIFLQIAIFLCTGPDP